MATLGNISFNIKNEYDAAATYLKDDIVHFGGHWHLCTTDTTAGYNPDSHAGYWDPWQSMFNWRGTYSHAGTTAYKVNDIVEIEVPLYVESKPGRLASGQNFGASNPYAGTAGKDDSPTVVASITVTVGGSGYTSAPTVTIGGVTSGGATTQATATAIVVSGVVTRIDVVTGGVGYNAVPDLAITGGGGTLAAATAVIKDIARFGYRNDPSERTEYFSKATYICTTAVTLPASPTEIDYPYSDNSSWELMTSEHEFDDTEILDIQSWNPEANSGKGQMDNAVKKVKTQQGWYTGNYRDCIKLPNKGLVGDSSKYYALGDNKQSTNWHGKGYINGAGGVTRWGSNDSSACGFEHDIYTAIETSHSWMDWFTSTDHKEWDSFLDGNIEDFRIMNNSGTSAVTVPTAAASSDIFTDLLIQSGSATDGSKVFTDSSTNAFTVMPHATLAPDSGNDLNHNDYNRNPDGSNKTSGWNQVQHSTDEKLFGTSSMKFGGDGDYLRVASHAKWYMVQTGIDWHIDFHIRLNDGGRGRGRQAIVENYYQKDYYWALYYRENYGFNFEVWWDGSMRFQTGWGGEIFDDDWYFIRLTKSTSDDYTIWKQAIGAGGLYHATPGPSNASTSLSAVSTGNFTTSYNMSEGTNTGSLWIGGRGCTSPFNTPDGEPPKAVQLETGDNHLMILFNNGEVWHGGYGGHGQNGDNSASTRAWMSRCGGDYTQTYRRQDSGTNGSHHTTYRTRMVRIATSGGQRQEETHSCYAIDEDGFLWSWGYNGHGQLGHANSTNYNYPRRVDDGTVNTCKSRFGEKAIEGIWSAGQEYAWCHAVDEDGDLWAWGYNGYGQLGDGTATARNVPTLIDTGTWVDATRGEIRKIQQCGGGSYSTTAILTSTGQIWVTGYNAQGWHAMDNTTTINTFTRCLYGPGSATWDVGGTPHADNVVGSTKAVNIWYTGNGNHVQLWIRDDLGYQWVCGRNHNYILGRYDGGTSNQSKPFLTYINLPNPDHTNGGTPAIAGQVLRTHLRNVKRMGSWQANDSSYDYGGCTAVTDEGNAWVIGKGDYGSGSTGNADSGFDIGNRSPTDGSHGIEIQANGFWQPLRANSYAQGHFVDAVGTGHRQGNDAHWMTLWQTDRNRCMKAGNGRRGAGQHIGSWSHHGSISPYIMDGVYN